MRFLECHRNDQGFKGLKEVLYQDTCWPLHPEPEGDFLNSCFVVEDKGKILSRAALFINAKMIYEGMKVAQVGSFESAENLDSVILLMEGISAKAKQLGFGALVGPMNGSTWNSYRFNCHQKKPFFTEVYHKEYYPGLWEQTGFRKLGGYFSSKVTGIHQIKVSEVGMKEGISLRSLDLSNYEAELEKIHRFCSEAFARNFLFTPISLPDFKNLYMPLKQFLDPKLVVIAEEAGEMVGLALCLPDHYSTAGRRAIIKTLARKPGAAYKSLGHKLAQVLLIKARQFGYDELIHAFMLQDGKGKAVSGDFFGEPSRKYALLIKEI